MACIFFPEQLRVNAVISKNKELLWDLGGGMFVVYPNCLETCRPSGQLVIDSILKNCYCFIKKNHIEGFWGPPRVASWGAMGQSSF